MCIWTLPVLDLNGLATSFTLGIVQGNSPLLVGLEVRKYSNTFNLQQDKCIIIQIPTNEKTRRFSSYVERDPMAPANGRRRIVLIPSPNTSVRPLMSSLTQRRKSSALVFAKQVHRLTHAPPEDVTTLRSDAKYTSPKADTSHRQCSSIHITGPGPVHSFRSQCIVPDTVRLPCATFTPVQ